MARMDDERTKWRGTSDIFRFRTSVTLCVGIAVAVGALAFGDQPPTGTSIDINVVRLGDRPIVRPEMMLKDDGAWSGNINFPCIIHAPRWLEKPLGKYYLYFSAHHGTYIRLAYADHLDGPWTVCRPGTLRLQQIETVNGLSRLTEQITEAGERHVASPDVLVDDDHHQIRMYFHFWLPKLGHSSSVAVSSDGINFDPRPGVIGGPYLRVFRRDGAYIAIDDQGQLLRSPDGIEPFQIISQAVKRIAGDAQKRTSFRHGCVSLNGDTLAVFFTRIGDAPERILLTQVALADEPSKWRASSPIVVLAPEREYEGVGAALTPSSFKGETNVRQLRDPYLFVDGDRTYLLYAVAGETGIGIATVKWSR
jgi:hypothetical protein